MSESMPNTEPKVSLKVAVGVVVRGTQVCLSRRRAEQHLAGLWEFPGGKIESGETSQEALHRELFEELGILVNASELLADCWT
jgi:ADP-ribose pyrophosphatase